MATQSNVTEGWSRWQIALAVGAPVALGLAGLWYYNRSKTVAASQDGDKPKKKKEIAKKDQSKEESPLEKAQACKNKGNKYFKGGKYDNAIQCYTEAIEICPKENKDEISKYYQNRAASYEQLKKYPEVIKDCSTAIEYDNKYTKAMFRRAKAYEQIGELTSCLEDLTAVCILEGFQNQQSMLMADRVLKEVGKSKAAEAFKNRVPYLPSDQFITQYFSAFSHDPLLAPVSPSDEDEGVELDSENENVDSPPEGQKKKISPYIAARRKLRQKQYSDIIELTTQEIDDSETKYLAEALLLRGTFYVLSGQSKLAESDLQKLVAMDEAEKKLKSSAWIKLSSLKLQHCNPEIAEQALVDMGKAVEGDPDNSDIYHQRGQFYLTIGKLEEALKDFEKAVSLNPGFGVAHAQKCYTEYIYAFEQKSPMQLQSALGDFEHCMKKFPNCSEAHALYGQALCDQQQFEQADQQFKKAIELEPKEATVYVKRGLLKFQWKQDLDGGVQLLKKAIEVDDKCELAYERLGMIEVQRGNYTQAVELFNKGIALAMTEIEMANFFSLLEAAKVQSKVAKKLGIHMPFGM